MKFSPPRPKSDDERILPLINVVFLLLIFFMLAGQLSAIDPLNAEPPRSLSEGEIGEQDLVIVLARDGQLAFDGEIIAEDAFDVQLTAYLEANPSGKIWLKADANVEALEVIALMEELQEAGVERLTLLTLPSGGNFSAPAEP